MVQPLHVVAEEEPALSLHRRVDFVLAASCAAGDGRHAPISTTARFLV